MVQWQNAKYNEQKVVVLLGGLHTELCAWSLLGKMLDQSGWGEALVEANVTSSGRLQTILNASHLKRTRFAHEVSVLVFSLLKREAFTESESDGIFDQWSSQQCAASPTFFFWDLILFTQRVIFMLVRSFGQRNFNLYVACLEKIAPLCFSLDATNYSRWLPVHIHDMRSLPAQTLGEFQKGNFCVTKSKKKIFSHCS